MYHHLHLFPSHYALGAQSQVWEETSRQLDLAIDDCWAECAHRTVSLWWRGHHLDSVAVGTRMGGVMCKTHATNDPLGTTKKYRRWVGWVQELHSIFLVNATPFWSWELPVRDEYPPSKWSHRRSIVQCLRSLYYLLIPVHMERIYID